MLKMWVIVSLVVAAAIGITSASQTTPLSTPKQGITEHVGGADGKKPAETDQNQKAPDQKPAVIEQRKSPPPNPGENNDSEDIKTQRRIADLTARLVWVGALQAAALIGTLVIVWRQAGLMKVHAEHLGGLAGAASVNTQAITRQADLMQQQLAEMQSGGETAKQAAEAARVTAKAASLNAMAADESAKTALRQTEAMIEKERARITVTFTDESEVMVISTESIVMESLRLSLKNSGPTLAENIIVGYDAFASDSEDIPKSDVLFWVTAPASIEGNSSEVTGPLTIDRRFDPRNCLTFYVYLRVIVSYKDIFGSQINQTKITVRREFMNSSPTRARSTEFWVAIDDPEANESKQHEAEQGTPN